jgi:hypothetical protein
LEINIRNQRRAIALHLKQVPSLKAKLNDAEWWEVVWGDSVTLAAKETGIGVSKLAYALSKACRAPARLRQAVKASFDTPLAKGMSAGL